LVIDPKTGEDRLLTVHSTALWGDGEPFYAGVTLGGHDGTFLATKGTRGNRGALTTGDLVTVGVIARAKLDLTYQAALAQRLAVHLVITTRTRQHRQQPRTCHPTHDRKVPVQASVVYAEDVKMWMLWMAAQANTPEVLVPLDVHAMAQDSSSLSSPTVIDPGAYAVTPSSPMMLTPRPPIDEEGLTNSERTAQQLNIDPTTPLLALRIRSERAVREVERLEAGAGASSAVVAAITLRDHLKSVLADVERVAQFREQQCASRTGQSTKVKPYRMTAAGPVALTAQEMVQGKEVVGCSRLDLVDSDVIKLVERRAELRHELHTRRFNFHQVDQQHALTTELNRLDAAIRAQQAASIYLDGSSQR
jgi:hypothetical protein